MNTCQLGRIRKGSSISESSRKQSQATRLGFNNGWDDIGDVDCCGALRATLISIQRGFDWIER